MTWKADQKYEVEATKVRWELVPYFNGRIIDMGCGMYKTFPHFIGMDSGHNFGTRGVDVKVNDAGEIPFVSRSCDGVFSSHLLEHIEYERVPDVLAEWCRVTKDGGYIMLYLPDENEYPKVGEPGSNVEHQWNVNYERVVSAMEKVIRGWDLIDYQVRNQDDEYSLFFVFKLRQDRRREYSWKLSKPAKTCAVVRYGAFGDMIQTSSILPWLKEQGYHVTLYCSDHGYPVIKHDPHVDQFILQPRDAVPPQFLGEFWEYTAKKYDKWVNLSESVEGTLLAMPGRSQFYWPESMKAKYLDRNYLEFMHEIAEVPPPYRPKFYSTEAERIWAKGRAKQYGKRNILWSLSGSACHKGWPDKHMDKTINAVLAEYPDTHFVLCGDLACQILEGQWQKHPRVHCRSGEWSIRESMAFAEVADVVMGCETGLLNAAGSMDCWKVVLLSHSSENMLTKHWKNVIALSQPKGIGCPRQPCRTMHYNGEHCMEHKETGAAVCQFEIKPEMAIDALRSILGRRERMVA